MSGADDWVNSVFGSSGGAGGGASISVALLHSSGGVLVVCPWCLLNSGVGCGVGAVGVR